MMTGIRDRVLNFEFMSGDHTFKRQTNRIFNSQSLINKDRTFKSKNDRDFKV